MMFRGSCRASSGLRAFPMLMAAASVCSAGTAGEPYPVVFRIEARNTLGAGLVEIVFGEGYWDAENQSYYYLLEYVIPIVDESTGETVATLDNCYVVMRSGVFNEFILNFSVTGIGSETTFAAESAILQYLAIPAGEARAKASASFSVTDLNGDGALLLAVGQGPGPGAYTALVNANSQAQGNQFATLVNFVFAGPFAAATATQLQPPFGYQSLGYVAHDSMVRFSFQATPVDAITATTRFVIPGRTIPCGGDLDASGVVDLNDFTGFLAAFGGIWGSPSYLIDADLMYDGMIDVNDLGEMLSRFGTVCD